MGKRRKGERQVRQPDEYFTSGPLEFARFGRTVIGRSRATPAQAAAMQASMADRLPVVITEIDALVSSIATRIARMPPDRLLHMAWWEFAMLATEDATHDLERTAALRMVDYVQSIIASVAPGTYAEEISREEWNELKADVTTLFVRLTAEYQMCLTASREAQDPNIDMALEEFRMQAETLWLNVRGKRYHTHERQALLDVLTPHYEVLVRLFGIDAPALAEELEKILRTLAHGVADSARGMSALQEEMLNRVEKLASAEGELTAELFEKAMVADKELAERSGAVFGRIFGMDLFDVAKNTALPQALLDELTWSAGEDVEFFAPGDFRGWPLRIWPTMKRPFIRLDGRVLCFDFFSLFDNFYRVLRRAVVRRDPDYAGTWNERQQAASEELPFRYLDRLLPGARVYRPVYYRWSVEGRPSQWHEADGVLIYDDHMLIIEVKAGAYTYTSPANDLPAHLESLRNLLRAPARQGNRFADYLESAAEVPIADQNHREVARLRRYDFRHVTVCVVTLDAFSELAAQAQRLAELGIDVGNRSVWAVSIDDLRVHAELFDNPLVFLHFLEQRARAGQSTDLDLNDEMDHLGLYLVQNNYSQHAAELLADQRRPTQLNFNGFRKPIDDYFGGVLREENPPLPRQDMPARLLEIVEFLAHSNARRRTELACFLLDGAGDFRRDFCSGIEQALSDNKELKRARPLSIYGGMAMTLYVWSPAAPRIGSAAEEHTQAVMLANDEATRRLVELEYADDGTLVNAHLKHVSLAGLSTAELDRLREASLELYRRRLAQAAIAGSIGRNQPCPCGSGKKFKHCHGSSQTSRPSSA